MRIGRFRLATWSKSRVWFPLVLTCVLTAPISAQSEEAYSDSKALADKIVATIQTADFDRIVNVFIEATGGKMKRDQLAALIVQFQETFDQSKPPGTSDLMATKTYGSSVAKYWYRVQWEEKSEEAYLNVYVRLEFASTPETWRLFSFGLTDDVDDLRLP